MCVAHLDSPMTMAWRGSAQATEYPGRFETNGLHTKGSGKVDDLWDDLQYEIVER